MITMKTVKIPTTMKELDELIARDFNMTYYTLRLLEHFERLAIILMLLFIYGRLV